MSTDTAPDGGDPEGYLDRLNKANTEAEIAERERAEREFNEQREQERLDRAVRSEP